MSAFGHLARSAQKHSKSTPWGTSQPGSLGTPANGGQDSQLFLVDVSDIFYFFSAREGEGGVRGAGRGWGSVFNSKSQEGGVQDGRGQGAGGGVCGEFGNLGGGGLNIFFRGRNVRRVLLSVDVTIITEDKLLLRQAVPSMLAILASQLPNSAECREAMEAHFLKTPKLAIGLQLSLDTLRICCSSVCRSEGKHDFKIKKFPKNLLRLLFFASKIIILFRK